MIEKAIEKIKKEMEECKDSNITVIGEFLLKQLEINKSAAEAIVKEGKTIKGSLEFMQSEALKKVKEKKGRQVVAFSPIEGFRIVCKYFDFEAIQDKILECEIGEVEDTHNIETVKTDNTLDDELDLDKLLG